MQHYQKTLPAIIIQIAFNVNRISLRLHHFNQFWKYLHKEKGRLQNSVPLSAETHAGVLYF